MKPETEDWVAKAEGNWNVANREMHAADPVWDIICFLAQQCAEQYLKAFLEEQGIAFRKTHDLAVLLNSAGGLLKELDTRTQELAYLSTLGIAARYPGMEADKVDSEDAMKLTEEVRDMIRTKLGVS